MLYDYINISTKTRISEIIICVLSYLKEEERSGSRGGHGNDALQVKGVPMSGTDTLASPPSNFQRNTALPPLDMAPQVSKD